MSVTERIFRSVEAEDVPLRLTREECEEAIAKHRQMAAQHEESARALERELEAVTR